MALTSLDYSDILRMDAFEKKGIILNKTQVNKLLFMCYGIYFAKTGKQLFEESPKAWPYGPVFPIVYKRFSDKKIPIHISDENRAVFESDTKAKKIVEWISKKYSTMSAYDLSMWSHREGSPWYQTVYNGDEIKWNKVINNEVIKEYFKDVQIPD